MLSTFFLYLFMDVLVVLLKLCIEWFWLESRGVVINLVFWQRGRLEEQVRQHNEKRAAAAMDTNSVEGKSNKDEDGSYEVTLDDDFLTALEYGMPPASGMVWLSFCCILILLGYFLEESSKNDYFNYKFVGVKMGWALTILCI